MSIIWSDSEIALLEALRPVCSTREIHRVYELLNLDRTVEAISKKSRVLGLDFKDFGEPILVGITPDERKAIRTVLIERGDQPLTSLSSPRTISGSEKAQITAERKASLAKLYDELQALRQEIPRRSSVSTKKAKSNKESLCVLLSDSHVGRMVFGENNEILYNTEIAYKRITSMPDKITDALSTQELKRFDEMVLVCLGDHVDGEGIFPGQEMSLETHVAEQVNGTTKATWQTIMKFREMFPLVRIVTTRGNHGRSGLSPEANWDNMFFQQLELLVDLQNDPNLTINNKYGDHNTLEVKGWKGLIRHRAPMQADTSSAVSKFAGWHGIHGWDWFCYLPGTKVLTHNGELRCIEDLQQNTKLLGRNGNEVKIEKIHPARFVNEQVFNIKAEGIPQELITGVTGEHPFWITKDMYCHLPSKSTRRCHPDKNITSYPCDSCKTIKQPSPGWVMAKDVEVGDFVAVPYPSIPSNSLPYSKGLAKLLGYYLAEGHIIKESRKTRTPAMRGVSWTLNKKEQNIAKEISNLVEQHFGLQVHIHPQSESEAMQCDVFGSEIADFFFKHGGEYSHLKKMDNWVWELGEQDRLELLAGYLKGDGHFRMSNTLENLGSTASPNLASQIFLLGLSCGLRPTYTIYHIEQQNRHSAVAYKDKTYPVVSKHPKHIITFRAKSAEKIDDSIQHDRKNTEKIMGFFHDGMYFVRIKEVSKQQYNGPVYNIRTDTEEYVAGHLLTHNCYAHCHHWGVMTWNSQPIFRNGSLIGPDDYSEKLGVHDDPTQLIFGISPIQIPTFICPIRYK